MSDLTFAQLTSKITLFKAKIDEYELCLFKKLGIWYNEDLSSAYFSIMPRDILQIIKQMVPVYIMPLLNRSYYIDKTHCPKCNKLISSREQFYRQGWESPLTRNPSTLKVTEDEYRVLLSSNTLSVYHCVPCRITYSAIEGLITKFGRVKLQKCVFIETITDSTTCKNISIEDYIHVGLFPRHKKIIVTNVGVFVPLGEVFGFGI